MQDAPDSTRHPDKSQLSDPLQSTNNDRQPPVVKEEPWINDDKLSYKSATHNQQQVPTTGTSTWRQSIGSSISQASDLINDNLLLARYTAYTTVTLLLVYGLAQSPLFFRYRTVSELPSRFFHSRKSIKGRLIRISITPKSPIICHIRHLSFVESLLSTRWYHKVMEWHPSNLQGASAAPLQRVDEREEDLLECEIACVESPPLYENHRNPYGVWLDQLARERTVVRIQLLARREYDKPKAVTKSTNLLPMQQSAPSQSPAKRAIPGFDDANTLSSITAQRAICKMYYRSSALQLQSTDIADSLVRMGRASPTTDSLYSSVPCSKLMDVTTSVKEVQKDAEYLTRLSELEYTAAKASYGMWADPTVKKQRTDVMDEVNFQVHAPWYKKVWRWIRGG
jgi:hypothetical protein